MMFDKGFLILKLGRQRYSEAQIQRLLEFWLEIIPNALADEMTRIGKEERELAAWQG